MTSANPYLMSMRAAPVIIFVGLLMILLLYAGNYFGRSSGSSEEGDRRSASALEDGPYVVPVTLTQSLCFYEALSPKLEMFVDPLPILPTIDVSDGQQHVLKSYKISQRLHRDLPPTTLYAYGRNKSEAQVPGPALIARRNVPTSIRWENHISDDTHFLSVDNTLSRAIPPRGGIPTVTHLHGMESASKYDGHPQAWFTRLNDTGPKYVTQDYIYLNPGMPAMMWYHDHTVGLTRVNVVAGLAGPYIVRGGAHEEPVGLPDGDREIILMLQDKRLFANGSINFPTVGDDALVHPSWCPGYYGDIILANGMVWPYLDVLPFKYRLRILNGASERSFRLSFNNLNSTGNLTFSKIGTDGGYLHSPVILGEIFLNPAERVDLIVDFGGLANGTRVVLNNSAPAPFPGGPQFPAFDPTSGVTTVLQFRVGSTPWADPSVVPAIVGRNLTVLSQAANIVVRRFALTEAIDNVGNSTGDFIANRTWDDPATEFARLGSTEIWEFIGLTPGVAHPIHVHLVKFQLLSVQVLNTTRYVEKTCSIDMTYGHPDSCFLNASRGPSPEEIGWKDMVSAAPGAVTRIVMRFTSQDGSPFRFDPTLGPGYVWHCHLLSHEDNSMMRPLFVEHVDFSNSTLST